MQVTVILEDGKRTTVPYPSPEDAAQDVHKGKDSGEYRSVISVEGTTEEKTAYVREQLRIHKLDTLIDPQSIDMVVKMVVDDL